MESLRRLSSRSYAPRQTEYLSPTDADRRFPAAGGDGPTADLKRWAAQAPDAQVTAGWHLWQRARRYGGFHDDTAAALLGESGWDAARGMRRPNDLIMTTPRYQRVPGAAFDPARRHDIGFLLSAAGLSALPLSASYDTRAPEPR